MQVVESEEGGDGNFATVAFTMVSVHSRVPLPCAHCYLCPRHVHYLMFLSYCSSVHLCCGLVKHPVECILHDVCTVASHLHGMCVPLCLLPLLND